MTQEQVDLIKNGAIARYLHRKGAKAAEALDAALWEFHKQNYITRAAQHLQTRQGAICGLDSLPSVGWVHCHLWAGIAVTSQTGQP